MYSGWILILIFLFLFSFLFSDTMGQSRGVKSFQTWLLSICLFLLADLRRFKKLHHPPLIQAEICGKDVKALSLQIESLVPGTYLANWALSLAIFQNTDNMQNFWNVTWNGSHFVLKCPMQMVPLETENRTSQKEKGGFEGSIGNPARWKSKNSHIGTFCGCCHCSWALSNQGLLQAFGRVLLLCTYQVHQKQCPGTLACFGWSNKAAWR